MNAKRARGESAPSVPADLRRALASNPTARALWKNLTPIARMDFLRWIDSAKKAETRIRRIERTCDMLVTGKRRPCCYAVVPLNLYNALKSTPKAKAQWSDLTPIARRQFISWIESAEESETRKRRIETACVMLEAGKRRP
ncbi:MAG: hypothetical protein NVS1B14_03640 [Vulcanimicrobiaceae bacterium]